VAEKLRATLKRTLSSEKIGLVNISRKKEEELVCKRFDPGPGEVSIV